MIERVCRDKAGTSVANNNTTPPPEAAEGPDDDFKPAKKSGFSAFAELGVDDGDAAAEEEDFGGLMVCLQIHSYLNVVVHMLSMTAVYYQSVRERQERQERQEGRQEGRCRSVLCRWPIAWGRFGW